MKHLLPSLVAFTAAKRKAELQAEARRARQQLSLDLLYIRQCPGLRDPRLLRTAEEDED
ncbi:MAG TPA: hypothetical protein VEK73_08130 [Xanthobacteraceae bacterium]|nr:hypothetical protein [Xanthobacteraceae bacterium]